MTPLEGSAGLAAATPRHTPGVVAGAPGERAMPHGAKSQLLEPVDVARLVAAVTSSKP